MSNAVEIRELEYRASATFEIRDLALSVPSGCIFGFLGPNGAGKTTTIRLMLGLLRPLKGRIQLLGMDVPGQAHRVMTQTGYVPERPHLYPSLTVGEAMRFHSAFHRRWDTKSAEMLAGQFALDRDTRLKHLSKGEMGKLMILLALAQRPRLLVLDEPTDGLDPVVRRDVLSALLDYVSAQDATVFISSHLIHELERICDWIGLMDDGRMVAEMPMQSFKGGIKRLRVTKAPALLETPPFVLLSRDRGVAMGAGESWLVRGWQDPMQQYLDGVGAELREVIDLDLEECFVELLNAHRASDD